MKLKSLISQKGSLISVVLLITTLLSASTIYAQDYPAWFAIYLKDKAQNQYSLSEPQNYLSAKAIKNRQHNQILIDSSDLPVSSNYLTALTNLGLVKYSSRWQNSVLMQVDDSMVLAQILSLGFVAKSQYLGPVKAQKTKTSQRVLRAAEEVSYEPLFDSFPAYGKSMQQIDLIGLTPLHHNQYTGEGVIIAILDAGFNSVNKMKAFEHLYKSNRIIVERDLVNPKNDIYVENNHGTHVLSTIAGVLPNEYFGTSPSSQFILLRTEDVGSEYPIEEYYWLIGVEIADSAGAQIINSSLSYHEFDDPALSYNYGHLDGRSTIVSRAASLAVAKGILVVTSAGNEGTSSWQKIGVPADGINVITVGAVDSMGYYASLSSQGNTADGRLKPDLAAVGFATALLSTNSKVFYGNGTSFASPIIAGGLAILMQAAPEKTGQQIREALLQSCSMISKPDSLMGNGIPNFFVSYLILKGIPKNANEKFEFQIMPNPFSSGFYLVTNPIDSQQIEISIIDLSGKQIYQRNLNLAPGTQAFHIGQISELSNGLYLIKIKTNNETYVRKIIKQE